jgi:aminoglycoside phosphotransferase (APT) family kinase protein
MSLDPKLLGAALARMGGGAIMPLANIARLSGGANMESWSFDWGGAGYVLRRAPTPEIMKGRPFGHDVEAVLVRAAHANGVLAPEIVGELIASDSLGTGYIMRRIEAEANPAAILANPPTKLISDIARELARIHAIPLSVLPPLPAVETVEALAQLKARFTDYGGDRPILALAIKWCEDHLPTPAPPCLVHGDFRMGNIMVGEGGVAAILDWELAHIGDAHEDLAWGCINAWRFGHIDRPAFGCADLDTYFAAYEAAGGGAVDPDRFRFWLVYRTLWWGLCCLQMADIWRSGMDKSLERLVIGRRTSETEVDLLLLLEEDAPETQALPITLDPAAEPRRMGEPSSAELLEAITDWIAREVKPKAEGRDRFMAAVALNALGMLTRDAASPMNVHDKVLCDDILAGRKMLATPGLLAGLRRSALTKLAVDQPKYSALGKARALWGVGY